MLNIHKVFYIQSSQHSGAQYSQSDQYSGGDQYTKGSQHSDCTQIFTGVGGFQSHLQSRTKDKVIYNFQTITTYILLHSNSFQIQQSP